MYILIFSDTESFDTKFIKQIQDVDSGLDLVVTHTPTRQELAKAEIVIPLHNFAKLDLAEMQNLKWVHATSAGVNGIVEKLINTDILLTNSSGVHPIPIAEQIFAYLLMFARGMDKTMRAQIEGKTWNRDIPTFELHGKTIAIVGLGRIGEKVAQLAKAFDMRVLAVKTKVSKEKNVDEIFVLTDLPKVLQQADFIVNCLPGTEETKGLFGMKEFKTMKPSAYFINIGRGFSAVEKDLINALKTGIIAGAGLDVFEEEPLPSASPLWTLDNVIITPHTAGKTPEYTARVIDIFCTNLTAYLQNKPLPNLVDKDKGY